MNSYEFLVAWVRTSQDPERGASLVEYALLLAFIAIVCITAVGFLGEQVSQSFNSAGQSVQASN